MNSNKKKIKIAVTLFVILIFVLLIPYFTPLKQTQFNNNTQAYEYYKNANQLKGELINIENSLIYIEDIKPENYSEEHTKIITLIHGFGGSTITWRDNKEFFVNKGYRVIAIDLYGFGLSSGNNEQDFSHKKQAELINNVLNLKQIDKSHFIAHSMGANVISFLLINNPEKIDRIVIVDGAINNMDTTDKSMQSALFEINLLNNLYLQSWLKLILSYYITPERHSEILKSAYFEPENIKSNVFQSYFIPLSINKWEQNLVNMTAIQGKNTIHTEEVQQIQNNAEFSKQVSIIWGEKDSWIEVNRAEELAKLFNTDNIEIIKEAGHLPMEENPAIFNEIVINFLELL